MSDDARLRLERRSFSLPLERPLETSQGAIEHRDGFVVRVFDETETGGDHDQGIDDSSQVVGYGEATPLVGFTESLDDCEDALERAGEVLPARGPEAALEEVEQAPAARHALTLALADWHATRSATPLYRYLGRGPMVARIPVNATIGDADPETTAADARAAVDRGFETCKVKVGARSIETDVERVRRVRDAVGPDVELRVDANGAWTYAEALRAIEAFAELGVALVEQPLPAGALEGHAALRGHGVDIALDEGLLEHDLDDVCTAGAADVVVLKPMALGGIDVARRMAAWVSELGMEVIVTTTIDGVVARTGAVHLAAAIPNVTASGLATADRLAADLARDPVLLEKGAAVVPQTKGLGVTEVWEAT